MAYIRRAGERDMESIYQVINLNLDGYFSPDVINFFHSQWPNGQIVAEDPFGRIIGALCGTRIEGGIASISLLAVDSVSRGAGIGTQLLDSFRRICMMEGLGTIVLEVRDTNIRAIKFYERNGFVITEHVKGLYSDGGDGYRMASRAPEARVISS